LLALGAVATVLAIANTNRLVPYAIVWGDLGMWAQAMLTGGVLVFAGLSVWLAAGQVRRATEQEAGLLTCRGISDVDREIRDSLGK
jgi:hypothetical protein